MSVEVPCPKCGAKLKVPDNVAAGKKVKCKKCDTQFRLPGGPPRSGESASEPQALSVVAPSPLPLDDEEDVPMAAAAEPPPPARPARRDVASLPSADPFDFAAPAAVKPAAPKAPASPPPPPARPTSGTAKPATPAKPAFGAAQSKPASPPPPPAAKSPPPAKKAAPEPEPLPLDDEEPEPEPQAAAAPAPAPTDPFAFNFGGDEPTSDKGKKKRDRDEDEDDDRPRSRRKDRDRDEDDEDDRPRGKSRSRDEDDEDDEPRSRRGRDRDRDRDEDDEPRSRRKDRDRDDDRRDRDRKRRDDEDDEPEEGRRYVRPDERKGGKSLLIALVLGLTALGAAVAAVIVFTNQRKEADEAKNKKEEKKDEKKDDTGTSPGDPKIDLKGVKIDPKLIDPKLIDPKLIDPKGGKIDPKIDPKVDPKPKIEPGPVVPMLSMAATILPLKYQLPPPKFDSAHKPSGDPLSVEAAPAKVKRIFAPADRRKDRLVVVSQGAGDVAKGEKLNVDVYVPVGARLMRITIDGDGKEPKCDLSPDGMFFAAAGPDGKITIWEFTELGGSRRVLEGFDPYTEFPDQKKAGLAAVFFTAQPGRIVTVSTAGSVLLFDTTTKKKIEGTGPLGVLTPNKVVLGKNLAADDTRTSIVMAVNGVIYQIDTSNMATARKLDIGEVGRPLGLAVIGVPGRLAYAFETDDKGKKEKGILFCLPNEKPFAYRWGDTPGEPNGVAWAGARFVAFWSDRGVAYFEVDEKRFVPLAFAEQAGGKLAHAANEEGHWYLVPDPGKPGQSLLLQMATDSLSDFKNRLTEAVPPTARLDSQGLWK